MKKLSQIRRPNFRTHKAKQPVDMFVFRNRKRMISWELVRPHLTLGYPRVDDDVKFPSIPWDRSNMAGDTTLT